MLQRYENFFTKTNQNKSFQTKIYIFKSKHHNKCRLSKDYAYILKISSK